jgi:hypothetical protein
VGATSLAVPIRPGFAAVERGGGGAIVIDGAIAAGIDLETHVATSPLELEGSFKMTALPAGGALVMDAKKVVWLDDTGREVARAPLGDVPSPKPGVFVSIPEIQGLPTWASDGTVRWVGDDLIIVGGYETWQPPVKSAIAQTAKEVPARSCPPEMVSIKGKFCIDRYEGILVDHATRRPFAPDYPVVPHLVDFVLSQWVTGRERWGDLHARATPLPFLPAWQRSTDVAVDVRAGVQPSGYVTGHVAEAACAASGKRLCTHDEFTTACRGEADTDNPWGDDWEDGVCNVHREEHPAQILHGHASIGHLDPRLNRVPVKAPLLRATGASPRCRSKWGDDHVYDLVGNLDEWVDVPGGGFAGGFYSRSTKMGCDALITAHPKPYLDYSTGIRCCKR